MAPVVVAAPASGGVVAGTISQPTLGILDTDGRGVDLVVEAVGGVLEGRGHRQDRASVLQRVDTTGREGAAVAHPLDGEADRQARVSRAHEVGVQRVRHAVRQLVVDGAAGRDEGLGEDLRRLDDATTRRAMTGASLLAEALTRAAFGSDTLSGALGVTLDEAPPHVPLRSRGERIAVHDDEVEQSDGEVSGA